MVLTSNPEGSDADAFAGRVEWSIDKKTVKKKVLLADDTSSTRRSIRKILEGRGYEVFEAVDGDDALAKTVLHHPDLIILDVMMPVRSGLEVAASLKSRKEYKTIPILLFTGVPLTNGKGAEHWKKQSFADDFIAKPCKGRDLLVKIERLLGK
jgi:CheY-like chemotaxis protein